MSDYDEEGFQVKSYTADAEKEAGLHSQPSNGVHLDCTPAQVVEQPCSIDADAIAEALSTQATCDFAAVIRAVEPDVAINTHYAVFYCYRLSNGEYHWTRTLAEAQKIAAAIAACLPGAVTMDEVSGPCHWLRVKTDGKEFVEKEFTIYYTPEGTPCEP